RRTAQYDAAIAAWLRSAQPAQAPKAPEEFPHPLRLEAERAQLLKYGENPHQSAAFYRLAGGPAIGLAAMRQRHGPELGYNNLLDFSAALGLLLEFDEPAAVVIKHTNPCGAALGPTVGAAMEKAKASDPVSIYGGIVGVNRTLDMVVVQALAGMFVEILFAPAYEPGALDELQRTKKKCRVFEVPCDRRALPARLPEYRSVLGGLLAQSTDQIDLDPDALKIVTKRQPTPAERHALSFAWRVAKHAKSNAIVLTTADQVIGVGAGQMNRVDAAKLAVMRAREVGLSTEGTVCASDAFFPFRDGLDVVAKAGATAVIQPGGSVRGGVAARFRRVGAPDPPGARRAPPARSRDPAAARRDAPGARRRPRAGGVRARPLRSAHGPDRARPRRRQPREGRRGDARDRPRAADGAAHRAGGDVVRARQRVGRRSCAVGRRHRRLPACGRHRPDLRRRLEQPRPAAASHGTVRRGARILRSRPRRGGGLRRGRLQPRLAQRRHRRRGRGDPLLSPRAGRVARLCRRPLQPGRRAGARGPRRRGREALAALPRAGRRQPVGEDRARPPGSRRAAGRDERVNVLVVGGGGREHTLCWKLAQSPRLTRLVAAPEGSKAFAKRLMERAGIPTARYATFSDAARARAFCRELGVPLVVKADGLAAGKGAIVCATLAEADVAIARCMERREFGAAGATVVVEEFLGGEEVSFFALSNGTACVALSAAQDHKTVFDGDRGPNTGGMGAFTPVASMDAALHARVMREIVEPTFAGIAREGAPYRG